MDETIISRQEKASAAVKLRHSASRGSWLTSIVACIDFCQHQRNEFIPVRPDWKRPSAVMHPARQVMSASVPPCLLSAGKCCWVTVFHPGMPMAASAAATVAPRMAVTAGTEPESKIVADCQMREQQGIWNMMPIRLSSVASGLSLRPLRLISPVACKPCGGLPQIQDSRVDLPHHWPPAA